MRRIYAIAVCMCLCGLSNWARPVVNFSTFFGGYGSEQVVAMALDSKANIVVLGTTDSPNFQITNAIVFTNEVVGGKLHMFIAKFDPTGQTLIFSTKIGGTGVETPYALGLDREDNIYVTGATTSTNLPALPATSSIETSFPFLMKLNADASEVLDATTWGIPLRTTDIMAVGDGKVWLAGEFTSTAWPTSDLDKVIGDLGDLDAFLILYNSISQRVERSYRIGGRGSEWWRVRIAQDTKGNLIVAGYTRDGRFPVTQGRATGEGEFLQKYSKEGDLIFSILLPLPGWVTGSRASSGSVAVDPQGDIWVVTGQVSKLLKVQGDGSRILSTNSFPGAVINDLKIDSAGRAIVVGAVDASADFPIATPLQRSSAGGTSDAFVTVISTDGRDILFSTRYGAAGDDVAKVMVLTGDGSLMVGGSTSSGLTPTSKGLPLVNAFQSKFGGSYDAFLLRIDGYTNVPPFIRLISERTAAGDVVIRIPVEGRGYTLQSMPDFSCHEWVNEGVIGQELTRTNRAIERMKFFRLVGEWPR